ncbi:MAG: DUF2855 family protein, partial [Myxococcales bacterium]|nr:DUF2855 family protein [Myxococcales bacterium]
MTTTHFLVRRDRLAEHELVTEPRAELAPGDVELCLERFGLTANNVTYGALGDALGYWKFFPEARPGWGRLPVWGFARVERSTVEGVDVGERVYGYFSMSSHLVVQPRRVDVAGFLDGAAHRRELSPIYNQYLRTSSDPSYRADSEGAQVVLRPLFATAYFLADYLQSSDWLGSDAVLISSASSKLASLTALLLGDAARRDGREVVGLTSPGNAAYVVGLGLYDRVVTYDAVSSLTPRRTTYVDVAGNTTLRAAVHHQLGDALKQSLMLGGTHWEARGPVGALPGPAPELFFAPTRIRER